MTSKFPQGWHSYSHPSDRLVKHSKGAKTLFFSEYMLNYLKKKLETNPYSPESSLDESPGQRGNRRDSEETKYSPP